MTPKEKAKELVRKFKGFEMTNERIAAKQCAIITVDEIYNGGLHLHYGAYLDEFEDKQNYYSYWEKII